MTISRDCVMYHIPVSILDIEGVKEFIEETKKHSRYFAHKIDQEVFEFLRGQSYEEELDNLLDILDDNGYRVYYPSQVECVVALPVNIHGNTNKHRISKVVESIAGEKPLIISFVSSYEPYYYSLDSLFNYVFFTEIVDDRASRQETNIFGIKIEDEVYPFFEYNRPAWPSILNSLVKDVCYSDPYRNRVFTSRARNIVYFNYNMSEAVRNTGFGTMLMNPDFWVKFVAPIFKNNPSKDVSVLSEEDWPDGYEEILRLYTLKSQIIKDCASIREESDALRSTIKQAQRDIGRSQLNIVSNEQKYQTLAKSIRASNIRKLFDQVLEIEKLPYIREVAITSEGFTVYTNPIMVEEVGIELGGYKVVLDTKAATILIENQVNPQKGYAHPHIPQNDDPCFGNYSDIITHLANNEIYPVVEMLHEMLSTFNMDDEWGTHMFWWDERATIKAFVDNGYEDNIPSDYSDLFYKMYGRDLAEDDNHCPRCHEYYDDCVCETCERCGNYLDDCSCDRCERCGELIERGYFNCECDRCPDCNELINNCDCEYCPKCEETIEHCECDRCSYCGDLLDRDFDPHCECERCPECDALIRECICVKDEDNE